MNCHCVITPREATHCRSKLAMSYWTLRYLTQRSIWHLGVRLAANIFVFVISWNFRKIFNFVFGEIFLEFREILRKTKSKFGRKFRNLAKHEIKMWATFWPFCKREVFFFTFKNVNNYLFLWHNVHQIKMDFDKFSFRAKKVCFLDFLKAWKLKLRSFIKITK